MDLPEGLFLDSISERKIYYFSSNRLNTAEPHYYICIKRTEQDLLILSCCTSQFQTIQRFVESRKLPRETLVYIPSKASPIFTKDTFVNCNETHNYTIEEFQAMYADGQLEFRGEASAITYEQIIIGLHESPLIEEELKELLPKV